MTREGKTNVKTDVNTVVNKTFYRVTFECHKPKTEASFNLDNPSTSGQQTSGSIFSELSRWYSSNTL